MSKEPRRTARGQGFIGQELRRPDSQGRIVIGKEFVDETFAIEKLESGDILLRPVVVVHKREAWLLANHEALASLKRGIADATAGNLYDLGPIEDPGPDAESE